MTSTRRRRSRELTTRQALLGGLVIVAVAAGIVAGLSTLLRRGEQVPVLDAPAEPVADPCPAEPGSIPLVTSDRLIECPQVYDGRVVRYRGEAVRAVLRRGDRAWVHVNDDRYALGLGPLPAHRTTLGGNSGMPVSVPVDVADRIAHVGNARHSGDVLAITGTYRRADPADDGGPTIHARHVVIEQAGRPVERPVSGLRVAVALLFATLAIASAAAARFDESASR